MPRVRMYPKHPFSQQCVCSIQNFLIQGSVSFGSTTILAVGLGAVIVIICLVVILVCCIRRWAAQWLLTWKNLKIHSPLLTFELNTVEYLFAILCKGGSSAEPSRTTSTKITGSTRRTGTTLWWRLSTRTPSTSSRRLAGRMSMTKCTVKWKKVLKKQLYQQEDL